MQAIDIPEVAIAEIIAILAHYGQTTESEGAAYIHHPAAVAADVPDEYKAVAWLHDVLEDSSFTAEHLLAAGIKPATVEAVEILTRAAFATPRHWARSMSSDPITYPEYIQHIAASGNRAAITVKLADLRHNLRPGCPEGLARRYRAAVPILEEALAKLKGEKLNA